MGELSSCWKLTAVDAQHGVNKYAKLEPVSVSETLTRNLNHPVSPEDLGADLSQAP